MDVDWRRGIVKGRGGGPLLLDDPALRAKGYAPPWVGLRCEHHAIGRSEFTAAIYREERRGEGLINKVIYRLPLIRSCCAHDELNRTAWWHDVEWAFKIWEEAGDPAQNDELDESRGRMLCILRMIIPKPSPAGVQRFNAFREAREAEDLARDEANRAYWTAQVQRDQDRTYRKLDRQPTESLVMLGLRGGATLDQVKARHRALAMLHHPDRGGSAVRFQAIQAAYEQAVADLERRGGR